MVGRTWGTALVLCCVAACCALSAAEIEPRDETFDGFLYAGSDGHVWLGTTMTTLGMWGSWAGVTEYRLSPALAGEFAPLVNRIGDLRDRRRIFTYNSFLGGYVKLEQTPTVLICLRGHCRLVKGDASGRSGDRTFEIVSARLIYAQRLTREWLEAWQELDAALREIVDASLTAPDEKKRNRLAQAIDKGSLAVNAMGRVEVAEDFRAAVRKIDTTARVVTQFQRAQAAGEWRRQLEKYVTRLRIQPETPLPPLPQKCPVLQLLVESGSPAEFLAKIRESCPAEALEASMLYSRTLERIVYVWEVEELTGAQFRQLRAEAKARYERSREDQPIIEEDALQNLRIDELGVVVGLPSDDLMADKLILGGILVDTVLPGGERTGLKAGDIILNYERVYDIVMAPSIPALRAFARRARGRRVLQVLRGNDVLTVTIAKK